MKRINKISIIFALVFPILLAVILSQVAFADGMYFSETYRHLYEPSQKALIYWDGEVETMVLSSAVRFDDLEEFENYAWVVPIQSNVKPEVTAADSKIFNILVKYFNPMSTNLIGNSARVTIGFNDSGVEIIETKEIDVYDITVIRADNPTALVEWLNNNGFAYSEDAEEVFNSYVKQDNFYFVVTKVDLRNKHNEALEFISTLNQQRNQRGNYYQDLNLENIFVHINNNSHKMVTYDILSGMSYEEASLDDDKMILISQEQYQDLQSKYSINIDSRLKELNNGRFYEEFLLAFSHRDSFNVDKYLSELHMYCRDLESMNADKKYPNRTVYKGDSTDAKRWYDYNLGNCSDVRERFGSLEGAGKVFRELPYKDYYSTINALHLEIGPILEEQYDLISTRRDLLNELSQDYNNLKAGMATPLMFKFHPDQPFYPLYISSLSSGITNVDVYVAAKYPVKDSNNVLELDKVKRASLGLKKELRDYIEIPEAKNISRVVFRGQASVLYDDAVFVMDMTPSIVRVIRDFLERIITRY